MRFTLPTVALVAVACMPRVAQANFDIYRVEWIWINRPAIVWQAFEAEVGCDEAIHSPTGVRCKGSGCAPQPSANDIDELEMHFSNDPLYHWSQLPLCGSRDRGASQVPLPHEVHRQRPSGQYQAR
ncbi:hypothetical protein LY76DRAFT_604336 [Colletotrichum caudatum]|nr:hypothetical protein LY76DRAFT_604336 [Colletotrichum caudatum]